MRSIRALAPLSASLIAQAAVAQTAPAQPTAPSTDSGDIVVTAQ